MKRLRLATGLGLADGLLVAALAAGPATHATHVAGNRNHGRRRVPGRLCLRMEKRTRTRQSPDSRGRRHVSKGKAMSHNEKYELTRARRAEQIRKILVVLCELPPHEVTGTRSYDLRNVGDMMDREVTDRIMELADKGYVEASFQKSLSGPGLATVSRITAGGRDAYEALTEPETGKKVFKWLVDHGLPLAQHLPEVLRTLAITA